MEMTLLAVLSGVTIILLIIVLLLLIALKKKNNHQQLLVEQNLKQDMSFLRQELNTSVSNINDNIVRQILAISQGEEQRYADLRNTMSLRLQQIQEDNNKRLEEIRQTVDENLHKTLENRLGESFKQVSERLEQVHKGLGEMQTLASGVGDLKKILSNVRTRGTWGEVQLGVLLGQILAPGQYESNIATKKSAPGNRVEFAVKLPGKGDMAVYLPIDAKFPMEDYLRLVDASEAGDLPLIEEARHGLEQRIKLEAKNISEKYLEPPYTTDFGIMFLPVEGLYSEVLRYPALIETLQDKYKVVVAGPTTLAALLNSLSMGFRTLAIEERATEVWELLAAVKTGFVSFGLALDKTQKKLTEASNVIDDANKKSRSVQRKLKSLEELSAVQADTVLGWNQNNEEDDN